MKRRWHPWRSPRPLAAHAHAKDFHFKKKGEFVPKHGWFSTRGGDFPAAGAMIGHGVVNVPECLKDLAQRRL